MRKRIHSLKKPKTRADWSKWNLYNLSRMVPLSVNFKTFFQQKWSAKSMTRAFHGNQIREGQWEGMFDRRLPAVVPMNIKVLATTDGSAQAAGRGSGLDIDPRGIERSPRAPQKTPYMQMTYWPTERRLDTAIWRSLFASSVSQARQFVVHGFVKVNGKPMPYPGYLLNPGDMFQVEPDRVLFATGARKHSKMSAETKQGRVVKDQRESLVEDEEDLPEEDEEEATPRVTTPTESESTEKTVIPSDPKEALKTLMTRARKIVSDPKEKLSGKRKQDLREFTKVLKRTLSQLGGKKQKASEPIENTIETLEEALSSIISKLPAEAAATSSSSPTASQPTSQVSSSNDGAKTPAVPPTTSSNPQMQDPNKVDNFNARRDAQILHRALQRAQENPVDVRKPYATPWQPREFMSAFAFIPRYLEVNQNICSTVYLRHPVARPGLAEVPSPFHEEVGQLAFNWYLRRR